MYKYLLFSEPQSLVFYSSATALARAGNFYFATTKMKQLIFRSTSAESKKATISLSKPLHLSRSETISLMQVLDLKTSTSVLPKKVNELQRMDQSLNCENDARVGNVSATEEKQGISMMSKGNSCVILMGTSKLNFYEVVIDLDRQEFVSIQKVDFGYKSSLKRLSSNARFVSPREDLLLMISANFVFYLTKGETRFKLLKILKEKVISLQVDVQDKNKLYILGKRQIIFGKIEQLPGGRISFQEGRSLPNKRKFTGMKVMKKKLAFFNKHRQIRIYELDRQDFTYKIEIFQSFKQALNFDDIYIINDDIIAVHDQKYLYCLSVKMNRIWQILNLSDSHFAVLPDGQVLTLQPKSENLFCVSQVKVKTYQKANKINKYLALDKYEKLKIIFAYLTRKFLKLFKFQDYNKVIYDLLLKMNLSNGVIKQPEFKAEVLKFYNLITDFSMKVDRSAVKGTKPRSSGELPLRSSKNDGGSVYGSNQSGKSSTSPSPQGSPKKRKNLNFMVVKPFVEIRLPRKNCLNETVSEDVMLKKIMLKGGRHYRKFLAFKAKDPYPQDSIDSVYARFQSRLIRIQKGKFYIRNIIKYFQKCLFEQAQHLFFIVYKFNMNNNIKLMHCIFMGFDLSNWMSPLQRQIHYQVIIRGIAQKHVNTRFDESNVNNRQMICFSNGKNVDMKFLMEKRDLGLKRVFVDDMGVVRFWYGGGVEEGLENNSIISCFNEMKMDKEW